MIINKSVSVLSLWSALLRTNKFLYCRRSVPNNNCPSRT